MITQNETLYSLCRKIIKEDKNVMFANIYDTNGEKLKVAHILYVVEKERRQDSYNVLLDKKVNKYNIDNHDINIYLEDKTLLKIDLVNNEKVASINYKDGIDYFTLTINKGHIDLEDFKKNESVSFFNGVQCQCIRKLFDKEYPTIFEDIIKRLQDNHFTIYIRNNYGEEWQIYKKGIEEQWKMKN